MIEDIFKIPIGDFTHIESDALVTSIRSYRTTTKAMYNSLPDKNHPSQNFYESMDAYKQSVSQTKNREGHNVEEKRQILLQEALDLNYNIIYDTICDSIKKQNLLLNYIFPSVPDNYDIIILYPVVSIDILQSRVKKCAEKQLHNDPPYYRATNPKRLNEREKIAREFFVSSLLPLMFSKVVKQIYMYNNETYVEPNFHKPLPKAKLANTRVKPKRISNTPSFFGYNADGKAVEYTNSTRKTIKRRLNNPYILRR